MKVQGHIQSGFRKEIGKPPPQGFIDSYGGFESKTLDWTTEGMPGNEERLNALQETPSLLHVLKMRGD